MAYSIDLSGRVAFITGASGGLGAQFARVLSSAGAAVVLASRRLEKLKDLRAEIEATGASAHVVELDVTDPGSIRSAVAHAETEVGSIDILVNNSGVTTTQRLEEVDAENFDYVFNTNVKGAFFVAQEVGKRMLARARCRTRNLYRRADRQRGVDGRAASAAANRCLCHEQGGRGAHDAGDGSGVGQVRHQR